MNKKEFIERLISMIGVYDVKQGMWERGWDAAISDAITIAEELDESEKPVIPKFVADWIEEERATIIDWHTEVPERFFLILGHKLNYTTLASTNIGDWVFGGNEEKLYQSLKYGYEVEKEKLYRVVFPYKGEKVYLKEGVHGDFDVIETETYGTQYTEAEIKAIDERFWAFAEEVKPCN